MKQLMISDYLKPEPINAEQIIEEYPAGTKLYHVIRGDVIPCWITDEKPWIYDGNTIYRVSYKVGYGIFKTNQINYDFYTDEHKAMESAEEYLNTHDVIRASDMCAKLLKAYSVIRECDKREMTCFIAELDNGCYYLKGFYTYHHIVIDKKKAIKEFEKEIKQFSDCEENRTYEFALKNMYRCKDSTWDYAQCEYNH